MNFMQPIIVNKITPGEEWIYEMKYDGFRAQIYWSKKEFRITSRNQKDLTNHFPEITEACRKMQPTVKALLPVTLDGELVILNHDFQANFSLVQKRGRLKASYKIKEAADKRPATFIAFDLLEVKGMDIRENPLMNRKMQLHLFLNQVEMEERLQLADVHLEYEKLSRLAFIFKTEGIVAKRKNSYYMNGKKHHDWYKEKNWRTIRTFLTEYHSKNDYFTVAVFENETVLELGKCKNGLDESAFETLRHLFTQNGEKNGDIYSLPPAICAHIHVLDIHPNELREPKFAAISPWTKPDSCTIAKARLDLAMLPDVHLSNTDKVFWPKEGFTKGELLIYIRDIAPYMLPYLYNRALTVIRCPDGIKEKSFFQKNLPSHAPEYIDFIVDEDKRLQLCNQLESIIWFANHSAIEYHIPFQTFDQTLPSEIVFDIDPPSQQSFKLAIKAAMLIKQLLDKLELTAFVKTSGNKGLQIHIPITRNTMTYKETAIFTEAIARTVVMLAPEQFTIERLKKHRGEKTYIDYVQHGKNRTIIAPYSPRKTDDATIATPLYWEELKTDLAPTQFTIQNVVERVQTIGCPWIRHYEPARKQKLTKLMELIHTN